MIIRGLVWLVIVLGGYVFNQFDGENLDEMTREQVIIKGRTTFLNYADMSHQPLDDSYSEKVFDLYLESLDGRKQFFTGKEVEGLRSSLVQLDDQIKTFDLAFFKNSYHSYKKAFDRAENMYGELLSQ